jgi:hypothetical protein
MTTNLTGHHQQAREQTLFNWREEIYWLRTYLLEANFGERPMLVDNL